MTNDLEARVVHAAREAVAADGAAEKWPDVVADLLAGKHDDEPMVRFAILGARAALAEIERDGEWQTIETAPRDRAVWVYNSVTGPYQSRYDNGMWPMFNWRGTPGVWYPLPTHWMTLWVPSPPAPTSHPQSADQTEQA